MIGQKQRMTGGIELSNQENSESLEKMRLTNNWKF